MISGAARRFPVRIQLLVPVGGFGQRLDAVRTWLDANCGTNGWLMTRAGLRGLVNDAVAVYLHDASLAVAFVARWCRQRPPEVADGAFLIRDDDPAPPRLAPLHKTP